MTTDLNRTIRDITEDNVEHMFEFGVGNNCLTDGDGNCIEPAELVELFEWWLKDNGEMFAPGQHYVLVLDLF